MSAYSTQKLPKTVYSTIDFLFFQYAFTSHKHTTKEMRTHTHARTYVRTQTHTQKKRTLHHTYIIVLWLSSPPLTRRLDLPVRRRHEPRLRHGQEPQPRPRGLRLLWQGGLSRRRLVEGGGFKGRLWASLSICVF